MLWTGRAALVQAGYELQQLMGVAKLACLLANPPSPSPLHALTAMMEPARQSGFQRASGYSSVDGALTPAWPASRSQSSAQGDEAYGMVLGSERPPEWTVQKEEAFCPSLAPTVNYAPNVALPQNKSQELLKVGFVSSRHST